MSGYAGDRTTGFASPAADDIEGPIDLSEALDLRRPSRYPVRVSGATFAARGILPDDVLVVDTSVTAVHGSLVVASVAGRSMLAELRKTGRRWHLHSGDGCRPPVEVAESSDVEIWAAVTGVVRLVV
ncbi:S24 family peptidase [Acetobacter sacchari]|uniref:S24 family peptidase n=1 Tax=Acetobacter sacchari TaxID=2661687 RepID=A0ABS3LWJ0_9PROT|nr:S24 family peptidase [Acetobacter sacchari]MBO1360287.1 S24 family peptidase [Acetobacter sacchari]